MVSNAEIDTARTTQGGTDFRQLLADYVEVCNRAIAESEGRFLYWQARKLNSGPWGELNVRALVYDGDPRAVVEEATLHFDPAHRRISIPQPPDGDILFSWKVSLEYLEDVVRNRPEWYVERPLMLDWKWLVGRARDESRVLSEDHDGRIAAVGVTIGLLFGSAATYLLSSRRG
jgi:hypothetical protein